jgi:hypothetical protein
MIIFPHVPKTAGSSLRSALIDKYGDRLLLDYGAAPLFENPERELIDNQMRAKISSNSKSYRSQYDLVYGHFPADRYESLGVDISRAIFFRDPVDRLCSNYFYRFKNNDGTAGGVSNVSIVEFANRANMKYVYQNYLSDLNLNDFDFIGITEHFSESLSRFAKVYGVKLPFYRERVGQKKDYRSYLLEHGLLEEVIASQKDNQDIYNKALERFHSLV